MVLPVVVAAIGVWIAFSIVVWATGQEALRDNTVENAPPGLEGEAPVSESDVGALRFDTVPRGYRADQVDAVLTRLAWELGRRDERLAELERELETVERPGAVSNAAAGGADAASDVEAEE